MMLVAENHLVLAEHKGFSANETGFITNCDETLRATRPW